MKQDSVVTLLAFGAEKRDRWAVGRGLWAWSAPAFEAGHAGQGQGGQGGQGQGEAIVKVDPRVLRGVKG